MDSLIGSVDSQIVLVVAALVVSLLLVTLLVRILKAGLGLILTKTWGYKPRRSRATLFML